MALETLKGVRKIGGFDVIEGSVALNVMPIAINETHNEITFRIQYGPIKEVGVNGCQVLTMIQTAKLIIEKLNEKFPCVENVHTLNNLELAIFWQNERTKIREARNVEGTNQA